MKAILEKLKAKIGEEQWRVAEGLVARGLVRLLYENERKAEYIIEGDPYHLVVLPVRGAVLTDGEKAVDCFTAAALIKANQDGALLRFAQKDQKSAAHSLLAAVGSALPVADSLKLEVRLHILENGLGLSLRTGEDNVYVVRDLPAFFSAVLEGRSLMISRAFTFEPRWAGYGAQETKLIRLLSVHAQALDEKERIKQKRMLLLPDALINQVLDSLCDRPFMLLNQQDKRRQTGIEEVDLPFLMTASGSEKEVTLSCELPEDARALSDSGPYFLIDQCVVRLSPAYCPLMREVLRRARLHEIVFRFGPKDLPRLMGELFPFLLSAGALLIGDDLEKRMIRLPLTARIYLDRQGKGIVARTVFAYGPHEIDPFVLKEDIPPLLLRDASGEKNVMDALAHAGFKVRRGFAYLENEDEMFAFVSEGVGRLARAAELYFSNEFKRMKVRMPGFQGRLSASGNRLELELTDDGTPIEELLPLLKAIRRKKNYFRFADGTFLDLRGAEKWRPLADAFDEAGERSGGKVGLYHAAYLNTIIRESDLNVKVDAAAMNAAALRLAPAVSPIKGLYAYQQRGFEWLAALYQMRMGGILADEMGLGKTVQMLSCIWWAKKEEKKQLPSLIVTPTSLLYNWVQEIKRFAPELKVLLISGVKARRDSLLKEALTGDVPDVILASYPVVRQDREGFLAGYYRFLVLDEAQNIKNPLSLSAKAVKMLNADCRVALSGTPMENNVGELWSLVDFALPGYLPPLRTFLRRYEDGKDAQDLRRRLRPFLMRRLKSDVMSELPEKMETTLYAGMTEEQRKLYSAVLLKKKESVQNILKKQGLTSGRGEVLAAMTELRQICCHPALVLLGYQASSGKEDLLMEILPQLLESGHRVLLFSQFTRMLHMIRRQLENAFETPLYLDGDTDPRERVRLADRFNAGEGRLFLISLKAGGTGLNLTGADTVIHFDPWWNPTAEDQATDRAHRLGQEKKVQVIRLVTLHSIEEKVVALGARKRQLFDSLITKGEAEVSKLTNKDILSLFEENE